MQGSNSVVLVAVDFTGYQIRQFCPQLARSVFRLLAVLRNLRSEIHWLLWALLKPLVLKECLRVGTLAVYLYLCALATASRNGLEDWIQLLLAETLIAIFVRKVCRVSQQWTLHE
jgi:hypothetical protein